jgi:LysM repeat protein
LDKDPIAKIEKPTKNGKKIYTIKAGDNLNEIAEQFGMTVARLMDINKLKKEVIIPGHTLYLE